MEKHFNNKILIVTIGTLLMLISLHLFYKIVLEFFYPQVYEPYGSLNENIIRQIILFLTISCNILFVGWIYRVYHNIRRIKPVNYSKKFAAISYFAPILNIVIYPKVIIEIYEKQSKIINNKDISIFISILFYVWWFISVVAFTLESIQGFASVVHYQIPDFFRQILSPLGLFINLLTIYLFFIISKNDGKLFNCKSSEDKIIDELGASNN